METSMIVNLCILGFILLTTIIGLIKGLYKSVITVILLAVSIFIGSYASTPLMPKAVDKIYPKIESKVVEIVQKKAEDLPDNVLLNLMESMDIVNFDDFINKITVEDKSGFEQGVKDAISEPVRIILWVIIAIIAFIILSLIGSAIGKAINKTPGFNTVNRLLGGFLGLATGICIIWGLCFGIAAVGLSDVVKDATQNSEVYIFVLKTIPESVFGKFQTFTIPVIGEIDISNIFK